MICKKPDNFDAYRLEVREFLLREMESIAAETEETGHFPDEVVRPKLREMGLLTLTCPQELGGWGISMSEYFPILEECSKSASGVRALVHDMNRGWELLYRWGTEEQKKRWLPGLAAGTARRTIAMTEPTGGTGVDIQTTATRVGDNYVINGKKHWASKANEAEPLITWAYTDKTKGRHGITAFIVGSTKEPIPGLTIEEMPRTMGFTGSFHATLTFENCVVPAKNILGKVGEGLDLFLEFIGVSRVGIATCCLGISQRLLDLSIDFAKKRVTFGKVIGRRQAIQTMLADMVTDIYALRSMIKETARKMDEKKATTAEYSMCKLMGIEVGHRVSDNALLIHGGIGYTRAYPVERLYRDVRSLWFEEGAPTIQKMTIARSLLGDAF